jgi:hypothetical protein
MLRRWRIIRRRTSSIIVETLREALEMARIDAEAKYEDDYDTLTNLLALQTNGHFSKRRWGRPFAMWIPNC